MSPAEIIQKIGNDPAYQGKSTEAKIMQAFFLYASGITDLEVENIEREAAEYFPIRKLDDNGEGTVMALLNKQKENDQKAFIIGALWAKKAMMQRIREHQKEVTK